MAYDPFKYLNGYDVEADAKLVTDSIGSLSDSMNTGDIFSSTTDVNQKASQMGFDAFEILNKQNAKKQSSEFQSQAIDAMGNTIANVSSRGLDTSMLGMDMLENQQDQNELAKEMLENDTKAHGEASRSQRFMEAQKALFTNSASKIARQHDILDAQIGQKTMELNNDIGNKLTKSFAEANQRQQEEYIAAKNKIMGAFARAGAKTKWAGVITGVVAAIPGAIFGGPAGATAGYELGSGIGSGIAGSFTDTSDADSALDFGNY